MPKKISPFYLAMHRVEDMPKDADTGRIVGVIKHLRDERKEFSRLAPDFQDTKMDKYYHKILHPLVGAHPDIEEETKLNLAGKVRGGPLYRMEGYRGVLFLACRNKFGTKTYHQKDTSERWSDDFLTTNEFERKKELVQERWLAALKSSEELDSHIKPVLSTINETTKFSTMWSCQGHHRETFYDGKLNDSTYTRAYISLLPPYGSNGIDREFVDRWIDSLPGRIGNGPSDIAHEINVHACQLGNPYMEELHLGKFPSIIITIAFPPLNTDGDACRQIVLDTFEALFN